MNEIISDRAKKIKPSASLAANAIVAKLRAEGEDIISLTIGEPDFNSPPHVIESAMRAARLGDTHYTPTSGTKLLKEVVVKKFHDENGILPSDNEVIVGSGAKQIVYTAFAATLNCDDEVLIPAPYWVSYPDMTLLHDGVPVIIKPDISNGFKITPEQLEESITPKTKWLILNSPNNPSGAIYSKSELLSLIEVLHRHPHVWLMSDEIYEHFVYENVSHISLASLDPEIAKRCLTINGVSKAYSMTGWRIGYATGPKDLINVLVKLISQSTTCPSSVSQAAAVDALRGDQGFRIKMSSEFGKRRAKMVELLNAIPGIFCNMPDGAFYAFPDVKDLIGLRRPNGSVIESDKDLALFLLEEAKVSVMPGEAFGLSPYLRCSFALPIEQIEVACERIRDACKLLRG